MIGLYVDVYGCGCDCIYKKVMRPSTPVTRISFAAVLNEVALANLVLGFDWLSTEDQTENNVPESIGVVIRRMFLLIVSASPAT
ncbi:hypothetical protein F2Q69_00022542 [Brassica cretica]|uniref:Uncharacterized protein n=1 Tax=Brassica cretica TaxID=69181 RepID=A0A8S9QAS8_BRACR|nr:hypothetical protein F2Q69_00022542 [Brassica cretica]